MILSVSLPALLELPALVRKLFTNIVQNRPLLEGIVAIAQDGYNRFQINSTPSFVINEDQVLRGGGDYDRFLSVLQ